MINILRRTYPSMYENFENLDARIFATIFCKTVSRIYATIKNIEIVRHVKDNPNTRKNVVI